LHRCIRELDVLQVKVQQEVLMICHPPTARLSQLLGRILDLPIRRGGHLYRIGFAAISLLVGLVQSAPPEDLRRAYHLSRFVE
jgi:hypothetical protein